MSRTDVLILGGGIIGCALAEELGRRGQRVAVLERGRIGAEASSAARASRLAITSTGCCIWRCGEQMNPP